MAESEATMHELTELLKWLRESAQAGQTFVVEQAPDLAREIVFIGRIVEPIEWLAFVGLLAFSLTYARARMSGDIDRSDDWILPPWTSVTVLGVTIGGFGSLLELKSALLPFIAPKLYLLDYVRGMVKGD